MSAFNKRIVRYFKRAGAGSMLISIIAHVIIILCATVYVISSVKPPHKANFAGGGTTGAPSVQHAVKMSNTQPKLETLTKRLSVDIPNAAIALPDLPVGNAGLAGPSLAIGTSGLGGAGTGAGAGAGPALRGPLMPAFGFKEAQTGGTLVGRLFDLKQTQQHKPTGMDIPAYGKVVDEYLFQRWDESALNRYYHPPQPVYTTQIFIPVLPAEGGPKAFGQEKQVDPKFWLIHYKGRVAAPVAGAWRFWGYGGEVCCVAINRKTVLVANHTDVKTPRTGWKSSGPAGQPAGSGRLVAGDWIELKAGEFVDIDVLIGERGGGTFDCFLLIEKRGENYGMAGEHPLFPVFQLAPYEILAPDSPKSAPKFAPKGLAWRALPAPKN